MCFRSLKPKPENSDGDFGSEKQLNMTGMLNDTLLQMIEIFGICQNFEFIARLKVHIILKTWCVHEERSNI